MQPRLVFLSGILVLGVADLEYLSGSHAFGEGEVRARDECPAQRDGEGHAEDAADGNHAGGGPVREALPPADHDQAREDEDDRRKCACRRCDGLHDVVFLDGVILEIAQNSHGDHGRGDRGGERQADAQPEVDVGCREDERDDAAEDYRTEGELSDGGAAGSGGACAYSRAAGAC